MFLVCHSFTIDGNFRVGELFFRFSSQSRCSKPNGRRGKNSAKSEALSKAKNIEKWAKNTAKHEPFNMPANKTSGFVEKNGNFRFSRKTIHLKNDISARKLEKVQFPGSEKKLTGRREPKEKYPISNVHCSYAGVAGDNFLFSFFLCE